MSDTGFSALELRCSGGKKLVCMGGELFLCSTNPDGSLCSPPRKRRKVATKTVTCPSCDHDPCIMLTREAQCVSAMAYDMAECGCYPRAIRAACYEDFFGLLHPHVVEKRKCVTLPGCVVKEIQEHYPEPGDVGGGGKDLVVTAVQVKFRGPGKAMTITKNWLGCD
jgi:hypothetical protein